MWALSACFQWKTVVRSIRVSTVFAVDGIGLGRHAAVATLSAGALGALLRRGTNFMLIAIAPSSWSRCAGPFLGARGFTVRPIWNGPGVVGWLHVRRIRSPAGGLRAIRHSTFAATVAAVVAPHPWMQTGFMPWSLLPISVCVSSLFSTTLSMPRVLGYTLPTATYKPVTGEVAASARRRNSGILDSRDCIDVRRR